MRLHRAFSSILVSVLLLVGPPASADNTESDASLLAPAASGKTQMRLYKMNRHGYSQRLRFTSKKAKIEGCHNLKIKSARVHRAVHFGFEYCTLYREKECENGSEVSAKIGDAEPAHIQLSQGLSWYLGAEIKDDQFYKYTKQERGKTVRSWSCQGYTPPPIKPR